MKRWFRVYINLSNMYEDFDKLKKVPFSEMIKYDFPASQLLDNVFRDLLWQKKKVNFELRMYMT